MGKCETMLFNNHKDCDSKQRFSIRKLTIGACSVLLSTLFLTTTNSQLVHAEEETSHNGNTDITRQTSAIQNNDKDNLEQKKQINASDLMRSAASDGDEQNDANKASEKAPEDSQSLGANSDAENKLKNENRGVARLLPYRLILGTWMLLVMGML